MTRTEYLLICLMEEAAEVQQAASKALRFGLEDTTITITPRQRISEELNDLKGLLWMLQEEGVVLEDDPLAQIIKINKVNTYISTR